MFQFQTYYYQLLSLKLWFGLIRSFSLLALPFSNLIMTLISILFFWMFPPHASSVSIYRLSFFKLLLSPQSVSLIQLAYRRSPVYIVTCRVYRKERICQAWAGRLRPRPNRLPRLPCARARLPFYFLHILHRAERSLLYPVHLHLFWKHFFLYRYFKQNFEYRLSPIYCIQLRF